MNPSDAAETDLVTLPSAAGATETVERLNTLLAQKGIEVFAQHRSHGGRQKGWTAAWADPGTDLRQSEGRDSADAGPADDRPRPAPASSCLGGCPG